MTRRTGEGKETTHRVAASRTRPRRRALGMALLAAVLFGGGGACWWYLGQHSAGPPAEPEPVPAAEQALREAAQRRPADAAARRALGAYLLEQHRPYEAMWAYQDALDLQPADTEACRGLARALVVARLPGRALEVLAACRGPARGVPRGAAPGPGEDAENARVAAAAYLSQGDAVGAVAVLRSVGPGLDSTALLDLGNAEEALGVDEAAAATYQRLVQAEPENVEGELALGRVAARLRRWEAALAALTRAGRADRGDPRPLYQLGLARLARESEHPAGDKPNGAIALFRRVLQAHPEYRPAHLQMGLWLLRSGQPAAAVPSLRSALAAHAGGEETRLLLATALEAVGQKAAGAYQRGLYFEATQQPRRALQEYQRLAGLDPARADVPLLLSAVYSHLEMNDRAAEVARKGLEQFPHDPRFLARRAMLLMMTENRAAGAELCRSWIERDPAAAEPYHLLGRIERAAMHPVEAVRLSEQAVARDPRNAEYCLDTALALTDATTPANLSRAAAALRKAIALDPGEAKSHQRLGEVLERLGEREPALRQYQRSMDCDPTSRFGAYSLFQLCPRLGKEPRARFYADNVRALRERADTTRMLWRRALQAPDDADAHGQLAEQLLKAGDLQQARSQLAQFVRLRPDQKERRRQWDVVQRLLALREE